MSAPVCPNCGQWQRPENHGDCLNECAGRGFAQRASFPAPPFAHTPGPWSVAYFEDENAAIIVTSEGDGRIAEIRGNVPEEDANASLIAAAPETAAERDRLREVNAEMLAALKWAFGMLQNRPEDLYDVDGNPTDETNTLVRAIHSAIARAEGR